MYHLKIKNRFIIRGVGVSHLFFFMIFIRSGLGVGLQQATLPPFLTVGAPRPAGGGQWFHKTEEWALLLKMHAIGYC